MSRSETPARVLLEAANPRPGKAVVEVAAGTGGFAGLLSPELGPTGRLVLTDLSTGMLKVARARSAELAIDPGLFERYREVLVAEVRRRAPRGVPLELGWTVVVLTASAASRTAWTRRRRRHR